VSGLNVEAAQDAAVGKKKIQRGGEKGENVHAVYNGEKILPA
jgi:hypothetical protein